MLADPFSGILFVIFIVGLMAIDILIFANPRLDGHQVLVRDHTA
jgi:hypothetical protein